MLQLVIFGLLNLEDEFRTTKGGAVYRYGYIKSDFGTFKVAVYSPPTKAEGVYLLKGNGCFYSVEGRIGDRTSKSGFIFGTAFISEVIENEFRIGDCLRGFCRNCRVYPGWNYIEGFLTDSETVEVNRIFKIASYVRKEKEKGRKG